MTKAKMQFVLYLALFAVGVMCYSFFESWERAEYDWMVAWSVLGAVNARNYWSFRQRLNGRTS